MQFVSSYALPWLTMLVVSLLISAAMTGLLLTSAVSVSSEVPTYAAVSASQACDAGDNWQLVYARTTGRVPASYCPAP